MRIYKERRVGKGKSDINYSLGWDGRKGYFWPGESQEIQI